MKDIFTGEAGNGILEKKMKSIRGDYGAFTSDNVPDILDSMKPRKLNIKETEENKIRIVKISSGLTHNAAFDQNGRLYTWGSW